MDIIIDRPKLRRPYHPEETWTASLFDLLPSGMIELHSAMEQVIVIDDDDDDDNDAVVMIEDDDSDEVVFLERGRLARPSLAFSHSFILQVYLC